MQIEVLSHNQIHIDDQGLPCTKLQLKVGDEMKEIVVPLRQANASAPLDDTWTLFIVEGGEWDKYSGRWQNPLLKK